MHHKSCFKGRAIARYAFKRLVRAQPEGGQCLSNSAHHVATTRSNAFCPPRRTLTPKGFQSTGRGEARTFGAMLTDDSVAGASPLPVIFCPFRALSNSATMPTSPVSFIKVASRVGNLLVKFRHYAYITRVIHKSRFKGRAIARYAFKRLVRAQPEGGQCLSNSVTTPTSLVSF